jgi:hypothetical protein
MLDELWTEISRDRLIRKHDDFYVIVPKHRRQSTPFICDVCSMIMKDSDDIHYFHKYGCCYDCGLCWADSRRDLWLKGWRPSKNDIQDRVEARKSIPLRIRL